MPVSTGGGYPIMEENVDEAGASPRAEGQRLDAFVDAAFAFAVSLLIISGGQALGSFDDLRQALLRIPAFLAGFALIVLFWLAHRNWSALQPARDGATTLLSLAIVFVVLVFVFPLRLLLESAAHFMSGGLLPGGELIASLEQLAWTYVIYGLGFGVLSVLFATLFHRARKDARPGAEARLARDWAVTWAWAAVTALLSSGLALTPILAVAPWLPGVTYWLIPLAPLISSRLDRPKAEIA